MTVTEGNRCGPVLIGDVFAKGVRYRIPIYQRSYAWREEEILQLLRDVHDAYRGSATGCPVAEGGRPQGRPGGPGYCLGTLVVQRERDGSDGVYCDEVVDGQQRLTTLYVLLCVLKKRKDCVGVEDSVPSESSLVFECRESSTSALRGLRAEAVSKDRGDRDEWEDPGDGGSRRIWDAFDVVDGFFKSAEAQSWPGDSGFLDYLLDRVFLIRDVLPDGIDLNRYFEVMNTRGEQLEAHEIVKARLMDGLSSPGDREAFAAVWDACSGMAGHVQAHFGEDVRERMFGGSWCDRPPRCWKAAAERHAEEPVEGGLVDAVLGAGAGGPDDASAALRTLGEILKDVDATNPSADEPDADHDGDDDSSESASIIDFPNFLLQTLAVYRDHYRPGVPEVALDDKALLSQFDRFLDGGKDASAAKSPEDFAKNFAVTLLGCRFLFDNYVIRSADRYGVGNDDPWELLRYHRGEECQAGLERSFGGEDSGRELQRDIMMLESMFQVTQTGRSHKTFLRGVLDELWDETTAPGAHPAGERFRNALRRQAQKAFRDAAIPSTDMGWDGVTSKGVATPHIVLNYLDYVFWVAAVNPPGGCEGILDDRHAAVLTGWRDRIAELFGVRDAKGQKPLDPQRFRFRYRTSVEHFFPQHPVTSAEEGAEDLQKTVDDIAPVLNDIGNLCIMSRSENSLRNNLLPEAKVEEFGAASQSLKFQIMAGEMLKAGEWRRSQIANHGDEIRALLKAICESTSRESM